MATRALRAVPPGEKPASRGGKKPPSKSVTQAAADGSRRELLVAMRDRIARTVDSGECPPRDLAALTRRLDDFAKEIAALDLAEKQEAAESARVPDEEFDAEAL